MHFRLLLAFLFLSAPLLGEQSLPNLSEEDVTSKLQEIMGAHVSQKELNKKVMGRTLINYVELLDPRKMYFLEEEVQNWTDASDEFLSENIQKFHQHDFSTFFEMHAAMLKAIERRERLEKDITEVELPEAPDTQELNDLPWARDEKDLQARLASFRSLVLEAARQNERAQRENADEDSLATGDSKDKFLQRVAKQRKNFEKNLTLEDPEDTRHLVHAYILKAAASALDTHTIYFTPSEASDFLMGVQKRLFGIGARLRDDLTGLRVVDIIKGGPADLSKKLQLGDLIIAVDGESIVGWDSEDAVNVIRGDVGTPVELTVVRKEEGDEGPETNTIQVEIVRGEVVITETRIESEIVPFGDGVLAKVSLHSFYEDPNHSSAGDVQTEIEKIENKHKLLGVILDLRDNPGGMLPEAVNVAGLFITKGTVVSIKDHDGTIRHLRDIDGTTIWDGPLIVLINRRSASAAEIVAQTLQDYGRAIVVGDDHSFGKGSFQTFTLAPSNGAPKVNPKGEYKVTRGKYYTVSGQTPQLTGVVPDVVIPGILSEAEVGEAFVKFPLENDTIAANFEDDLSDIPLIHRAQIRRVYSNGLQKKINQYTRHLPLLKKNSEERLQNLEAYQSFLAELKKDEPDLKKMQLYGHADFQLTEAVDVLKDLVVLTPQEQPALGASQQGN